MVRQRVSLESDFRDYYDHLFYSSIGSDSHWKRMAYDSKFSIPKRMQFHLLEKAGFRVPINGFVEVVAEKTSKVVVYLDERQHMGEGKILLSSEEAIAQYPACFCSEYIDYEVGRSCRLLQVGNRSFVYWYKSSDDWRSNCGDTIIAQAPVEFDFWDERVHFTDDKKPNRDSSPFFAHPMFAIDVVPISPTETAAIDFNTAPGLKWSGMESIMSATNIYDAICDYLSGE